jgi:hypothetical protein
MLFQESRDKWLQQAQALLPVLQEGQKKPQQVIQVVPDEATFQGWRTVGDDAVSTVESRSWGRNESFILDFNAYLWRLPSSSARLLSGRGMRPVRLNSLLVKCPPRSLKPSILTKAI